MSYVYLVETDFNYGFEPPSVLGIFDDYHLAHCFRRDYGLEEETTLKEVLLNEPIFKYTLGAYLNSYQAPGNE